MSLRCSFCGKTEDDNIKIIEGVEANICINCVSTCNEIAEELKEELIALDNKFPKPYEIKAELDKYVIGQEEAKKILSVAVYNHYKRINIKSKIDIQKTNILLIGPTGSGKTYMMQVLSKILDVPLVIADATSLTEAGYVGDDVETILEKLIRKANGDVKKAERGIVYIDEIDKLAVKKNNHDSKDPSGEGVQQALLKIVEDNEIVISSGDVLSKRSFIINTKNILFVCGGAFTGINEIINKRVSKKSKTIGFNTKQYKPDIETKNVPEINQQDVVEYGLIPEFVGRLPVIVTLNQLNKEDLKNILIKPKNAILKQYKALFKMDGVNLTFNNSAIAYIVDEALKKNIGARGLKGVIEKKMYNLIYELPKHADIKSYEITKEMLKK